MAAIRRLDPHDPLPDGPARRVVVLRRFDEDEPGRIVTDISLHGTSGLPEVARPAGPGGQPLSLDDVVAAAVKVADSEGIATVTVIDRTAGPLEREVIGHAGDHAFAGRPLDDSDPEDGERGPDMRDRT